MAIKDIEKFFKEVPGSKSEIRDMDAKITQSGDYQGIRGVDVIIRSISRLLLIPTNTYIFDPELGTGLYKYIFEPADMVTKSAIEQVVAQAIHRYENRAKIDYKVLFFKNRKGFRIDLYIEYEGQKRSVSVDINDSMLKTLDR